MSSNLSVEYLGSELLPKTNPADIIWYRYVDDVFSLRLVLCVCACARAHFFIFSQKLNFLIPTTKF